MSIIKEFKEFAIRGNVIDLAVGVVIGGAFGKIVTSFVDNVLMPPIGYILGGVNFSDLKFALNETTSINYGAFIQSIIDFTIIAFAIFMMIKAINSLKKKEEEKEETPAVSTQETLLTEIRDLLKDKK